jgi:mannobiose 2-epimerase
MVYAQSFGIYAFAELYRATRDPEALQAAKDLYAFVETRAFDAVNQGYVEGRATDWYSEDELRIDPVVGSVTFSMNTHLHLVEAYTNLYLAWPDKGLRNALERAVRIMVDRVLDRESGHFGLHFDAHWRTTSRGASPGHDIEGGWLIVDAAEALGNQALLDEIWPLALKLAQVTLEEGIDIDDGVMQEAGHSAELSPSKDWWPQAEAMIGFLNAYQKCGFPRYLQASLASWNYIQKHIIDRTHGEWFWGVTADGTPLDREKTGPWKGPYHNARACMEVMRRVDALLGDSVQGAES